MLALMILIYFILTGLWLYLYLSTRSFAVILHHSIALEIGWHSVSAQGSSPGMNPGLNLEPWAMDYAGISP